MCVIIGYEDKEEPGQGTNRLSKDECRKKLRKNLGRECDRDYGEYFVSAVWKLLLFIIYVNVTCQLVGVVNASQEGDQLVNRLNYGVIFGYVGRTKPMTSLLRHTFKIALPVMKESDEREFLKKLDIISHERNPCLQEREGGKTEIHEYCTRFYNNLKYLATISRDGDLMHSFFGITSTS